MPKTRTNVDREQKMTEILDLAAHKLRSGGYNAVSVAAIARELGIAHNAIYWYFPSKDHLMVAAFEHIVQNVIARKPKGSGDVVKKVMWFVDQIADFYPLRASMHEQAQSSDVIATYLEDLNERLRRMTSHVLEPYVPSEELDLAVASFTATVQGACLAGIQPSERRRVLGYALQRLIGGSRVARPRRKQA
ncbi:MAG TPA: TetR/AcrR family transcriptional regulator [Actinomycetota bacterium]|nr:TetR/AcrR family transcriptional regulator [Actinomycetota bacterium]